MLGPEGLFYMYLIWGIFSGYDWRNCEMSDTVPGFEGVHIVQCYGPPLPPVDGRDVTEPRARVRRR
jgi:hypothetical protein